MTTRSKAPVGASNDSAEATTARTEGTPLDATTESIEGS
jgi:hypothetical protein